MRKLDYTYIKNSFKKEDYILVSDEYINSKTKLDYICPKGHKHSAIWFSWKNNRSCPYCAGNIRLTIEFIKKEFKKESYTLLSTEYINNNTKLDYICPNGHKHNITWNSWCGGHRCIYCSNRPPIDIVHVKSSFEREGYTLLTKKYVNARIKLDYVCPNGYKHSVTWDKWQQGKRCPHCAGNAKLTIDVVRSSFEFYGYILLSSNYINSQTKLDYICDKGHRHSMDWGHFNSGNRCPTCYKLTNFGERTNSWIDGRAGKDYCAAWKDKEYKESIKERDTYKCQNPYCYHTTNRLVVHHINYKKKICGPDNLITVCIGCNARANFDRQWHTEWYRKILTNKYNYKYL